MLAYYQYRKRSFLVASKELLEQVQRFGAMIALLFQVYVFGAVATLFMGIGKIVQSDHPHTAVLMAWTLLTFQSFLFYVFRSAILDSPHRSYHSTILPNKRHMIVSDVLLTTAAHPLLFMSMIILIAIGVDKITQAWQLVWFTVTQFAFAVAFIYRPLAVTLSLVALAIVSAVIESLPLFLVLSYALLVISLLVSPKFVDFSMVVTSLRTYWLRYFSQNLNVVIWRIVFTMLVLWFGFTVKVERPDLITYYTPGLLVINLLWWSSIMIDLKPEVVGRVHYWKSLLMYPQVEKSAWLVGATVCGIASIVTLLMLGFSWASLIAVALTPMLLICAFRSTKHLLVAWLATFVLSYLPFI
ncbi:DUF6136 family protein [Pseudoalteromonas sp. T1lg65]|uniref:DUF6136 family protein n=1 Tax=Pseudoalteromonas sp. T1lg65 TaxID=2077101 RepID=UPI003F7991C0